MPIMRCAALVFLTTLPGTVNAEYFVEKTYNSTDCSVSMYSTMITMGMPGDSNVTAFDTCMSMDANYTTYTCVDDEVVHTVYMNDTCTGISSMAVAFDGTCDSGSMSSCMNSAPGWAVYGNWSASATFYSDWMCETANGDTAVYLVDELTGALEIEETCTSSDMYDWNVRTECVNGSLGMVYYDTADTMCSMEAVGYLIPNACMESPFDLGAYVHLMCDEYDPDSSSADDGSNTASNSTASNSTASNSSTSDSTTDSQDGPASGDEEEDEDAENGASSSLLRRGRYWSIVAAAVTVIAAILS